MFLSVNIYSQEFSTNLVFQDANGNTDTLIVGYDPAATVLVDEQFGEVDISGLPIGDSLEVRLAQTDIREFEYNYEVWSFAENPNLVTYQSKIDILPRKCESYDPQETISGAPPHSTILIPIDKLPLQISWDSTVFDNECLKNSFLTSWPSDTLWDTQSFLGGNIPNGPHTMDGISELLIDKQYGHQYISASNDTMMVLFLFLHDLHLTVSVDEQIKTAIKIYPNPTQDILKIESEKEIQSYKLYNAMGQLQRSGVVENSEISTIYLIDGSYYLQLFDTEGRLQTVRFVKY